MWYNEMGENSDIIISSSVAVVRNIRGFNFPDSMNAEEKEAVLESASDFASKVKMKFVRDDELSNEAKFNLLNNKIIGFDFVKETDGKGLLINDDESLSVLVNQYNHFKIQGFCSGSKVDDLFSKVEKLAVEVEKNFDIAFSERLGFLTSRPYQVGTGLRVSFLVSIPGIEKGGAMIKLLGRLNSLDWKLVPYVGDVNAKKTGSLYEVFNTATLGVTEQKTFERALVVLKDIIKVERMCRDVIYSKSKLIVEDQYYRAYGLIKYCKKIELPEALEALGWLRLAHNMINDDELNLDVNKINRMTDCICTEMRHSKNASSIKLGESRANKIRAIMEGDVE